MSIPQHVEIEYSAIIRPNFAKALKSGKYPLRLYVTVNGERKEQTLKMAVSRTEWEKLNAKVVKDEIIQEKKSQIQGIEKSAREIIGVH